MYSASFAAVNSLARRDADDLQARAGLDGRRVVALWTAEPAFPPT
jgi:hypothetical protein